MDNVLTKVQDVFHEAFGVDSQLISLDTTPNEVPAWDSVGHLDLASRLEQAFGINLDVDDLMEMENVREIIRIVSSKL
jgi:acyl carrier protein